MRLLEIAPDFVKSQAGTLMTILQYLQGKTKPGTKVPISNISRLMNNAGYSFSFENLEELSNSNPALASMIGDFDENYITIGEPDEPSVADDESLDEPKPDEDAATVDKMAKSAANTSPKIK